MFFFYFLIIKLKNKNNAECILRFITEFNTHYGDRIPL